MNQRKQKRYRRGIYLLPNLFTTAALFCGFYAIVGAMQSKFEIAAIAIFVAMLLDGIDGRVARLTNTQSDFGAQYDSLADLISFGLAPSLVMYQWTLLHLGKAGWLAAFIYAAAAALRLARFNTQVGTADKRYFQGIPSPAAAAIVSGAVWVGQIYGYDRSSEVISILSLALIVTVGLLMVSNIRFHSFKGVDFRGKVPFFVILVFMLVIVLVSSEPAIVLFVSFLIYAVSGPIITLLELRKRRAMRRAYKKARKERIKEKQDQK